MARPRGNYEATEARKEAILVSAFSVFSKSGYRGGSLKQVADLVGISEADLAKIQDKVKPVVTKFAPQIGEDFIKDWLALIQYNMDNFGIVELFCILSAEATSPDHPAHEYFKNRYEYVTEVTTAYFETLIEANMLKPLLESADLSRTLIALSDGLQVQWLLDPSFDMLESHRAFFRGILLPEYEHLVAVDDARAYEPAAGK